MKTIVVTGANSYLGGVVVASLRARTPHRIIALVSPRATPPADGDAQLRWLRADLAHPLASEVAAALHGADCVFHFAWARTGSPADMRNDNRAMIEHLTGAMPDAARFWFISSASASPRPMSTYGATKHDAAQLVRRLGGGVLVCGLVVESNPARGPYRLLRRHVARSPFALRLTHGEPLVFPLQLADLGEAIVHVAGSTLPPAGYRMFSRPVGFNAFIGFVEQLHPRKRVPLALPASLLLKGAALAKRTHVFPARICDQVLTFLYKDAEYLLGHDELPGMRLRPCQGPQFVG